MTVPTEFQVETVHYGAVGTGQWDKYLPVAAQWVQTFPHVVIARINFGVGLRAVGRHEDALVQGTGSSAAASQRSDL